MSRAKPRRVPGQLVALNEVNAAQRAERVAEAWRLRVRGLTVRAIAERLNVSAPTCWDYVREGLRLAREASADSAEAWRSQMVEQLEELLGQWSPVALDPAALGSDKAAAIVLKCQEQRARLLGLDRLEIPAEVKQVDIAEAMASPAARAALRRMLDEADRQAGEKPALPA